MKVLRLSALRTGRLYPQEYPGTHFERLSRPRAQGLVGSRVGRYRYFGRNNCLDLQGRNEENCKSKYRKCRIAQCSCVITTKVKPGLYVMCNSIVIMYLLLNSCARDSHDTFISIHGTFSYMFRLSLAIFMEKILTQINSCFVRTCHHQLCVINT
jgi:hypothetical protein